MSGTQMVAVEEARAVLGDDVLGPEEVAAAFGHASKTIVPIEFTSEQLRAARRAGEMLVLRVAHLTDNTALTLMQMVHRFPAAFDQRLLRQMGYQLKDDWGIELEPLAATETCAVEWALVRKHILDESRNLAYEEQAVALQRYAETLRVPANAVRRRTAVEAVYDTILYSVTRGVRLLENTWDWCSSATIDGGYLNVGGFGDNGMQILSYSTAVRHGALGVCPTRQGSA
jgi:hypothetical protein